MAAAPHALVVGDPVEHSLSPELHRAAWSALGLSGGRYDRQRVEAGGLAALLAGRPGLTGLSVTMPLKGEALAIGRGEAPGLVGVGADEAAEQAQGANTLVRRDGGWWAANTDVTALERLLDGFLVEGPTARVVLVGSGATARSATVALARCGVQELSLVVRRGARREWIELADLLGVTHRCLTPDELPAALGAGTLVVSTVPTAAWEHVPDGLAAADLSRVRWLDAQYGGWPHPWAGAVASAGGRVLSGLSLLVEQAVDQVELMTGHRPTREDLLTGLPADLLTLHDLGSTTKES